MNVITTNFGVMSLAVLTFWPFRISIKNKTYCKTDNYEQISKCSDDNTNCHWHCDQDGQRHSKRCRPACWSTIL